MGANFTNLQGRVSCTYVGKGRELIFVLLWGQAAGGVPASVRAVSCSWLMGMCTPYNAVPGRVVGHDPTAPHVAVSACMATAVVVRRGIITPPDCNSITPQFDLSLSRWQTRNSVAFGLNPSVINTGDATLFFALST